MTLHRLIPIIRPLLPLAAAAALASCTSVPPTVITEYAKGRDATNGATLVCGAFDVWGIDGHMTSPAFRGSRLAHVILPPGRHRLAVAITTDGGRAITGLPGDYRAGHYYHLQLRWSSPPIRSNAAWYELCEYASADDLQHRRNGRPVPGDLAQSNILIKDWNSDVELRQAVNQVTSWHGTVGEAARAMLGLRQLNSNAPRH